MKNRYILLFFLVLLFSIIFIIKLNFVKAQEEAPGLPISEKELEKYIELPQQAQTKWEYLQKEWKNILSKNKVIMAIDTFMKKSFPNNTFRILFGINWNIEYLPTIIGIVVFWIILFMAVANLLKLVPIPIENQQIAGALSYVFSLLLMVIFAQINLFYDVINWLGKLIFKQENALMKFLYFFLTVIIFVLIVTISNLISKASKESKEKAKQEEIEHKIEKANKFIEGVKEGRKIPGN